MADTTKTDWTKGLDYYNDWSYGIPKNYVNINQPKPADPQVLLKAQEELQKAQLDKLNSATTPTNVPSTAKQTFLEKNQNKLIAIGVPLGFYAFSKYKKYDGKKTAKVTIIGSVVVLGLVVLNGFSGAWSGTTFMDKTFGKQK
jgi:hypothetical protein